MSGTNIVLTGFMGSGKTAAGKILAGKLGIIFTDIDRLIEKEQGMPISEIFSRLGEDYFRNLEKEMVNKISEQKNQVIATGGGVVLNPENMANLRKNGTIIWLAVSAEAVRKRTKSDEGRPLLQVTYPEKTIEELLSFRESLYAKADFKVETSNLSIDEVVREILDFLNNPPTPFSKGGSKGDYQGE